MKTKKKKAKYTFEQIETILKELGISGIIHIKDLGICTLYEDEGDKYKILEMAKTELGYLDARRDMQIRQWLQEGKVSTNKQNNKIDYV